MHERANGSGVAWEVDMHALNKTRQYYEFSPQIDTAYESDTNKQEYTG